MKRKILFIPGKECRGILGKKSQNPKIFNFFNLHDLYQYNTNSLFNKTVNENNYNFIDGSVISIYLSLVNLKKIKRNSGPDFTKMFLQDHKLNKNKKHLFIGYEEKEKKLLIQKFPLLKRYNVFCYNPPYIKSLKFSKKEINKMAQIINSKRINYIWVGVGSPKQNILAYDLSKITNPQYFFNVGAALDFSLEKKKRAPKIIRNLGVEWLYRLITDFSYSKKKVWRSFISLRYLFNRIKVHNV